MKKTTSIILILSLLIGLFIVTKDYHYKKESQIESLKLENHRLFEQIYSLKESNLKLSQEINTTKNTIIIEETKPDGTKTKVTKSDLAKSNKLNIQELSKIETVSNKEEELLKQEYNKEIKKTEIKSKHNWIWIGLGIIATGFTIREIRKK